MSQFYTSPLCNQAGIELATPVFGTITGPLTKKNSGAQPQSESGARAENAQLTTFDNSKGTSDLFK